jgi:hypothetical protein
MIMQRILSKSTHRLIVVVFCVLLLTILWSVTRWDMNRPGPEVGTALKLIQDCPTWNLLSDPTLSGSAESTLFEHLNQLSKYETKILRDAEAKYQARIEKKEAWRLKWESTRQFFEIQSLGTSRWTLEQDWIRLLILNHYIFNLPDTSSSLTLRQFDGFVPMATMTSPTVTRSPIWPLGIGRDGKFFVIPDDGGLYMGPSYQPLEEFDYDNKTFGRRVIPRVAPGQESN